MNKEWLCLIYKPSDLDPRQQGLKQNNPELKEEVQESVRP
ncbi:hypothetical protein SAMN02746065_11031 [Desulfocicer vacuolatum DSM 3385]|uniref:Uncharacterized protein n=1 Tax=Desulfocicer vacuolatum DSM 3385 TaxID=1121400 RepID=A0A1W2BZL8_9BACT|nr:hypothetical protein SAMN02746065_11031 [Desulfocicer vacuolatum DSM 3385]